MSGHRFFINQKLAEGKNITVTNKGLLHQWLTVLRFAPGEIVVLFDGHGTEATYVLDLLKKNRAELILKSTNKPLMPRRKVCLAWSLLKRENNELVIQKATELGVSHLLPVVSERCVRSHVSSVRSDRWQRIATEAAEQCGRSDVPKISDAISLLEIVNQHNQSLVVCRAGGQQATDIEKNTDITVLIGPEGGWSSEEEQLFDTHNITSLSLGQFTLRAETAAIVAAAKVA